MDQQRENLQKLIKVIKTIKSKGNIQNVKTIGIREISLHFNSESIVSLREVTRMFIEELNSDYLECRKDDEIIKCIEDIMEALKETYDNIVEHEFTKSEDIKLFKICGQLIKDYEKLYNEAKIDLVTLREKTPLTKAFAFGKKYSPIKTIHTNNNSFNKPITINLSVNGENIDAEKIVSELVENIKKYNIYK
jgi:hypothetical protein